MRERFGEHLVPLSPYQANCDIALMFSWYSAGYGWLVMACWGRRSGSWSGTSEDVWFCETCGVDPWRVGAFLFLIVLKSEVNGTHELFTPEMA